MFQLGNAQKNYSSFLFLLAFIFVSDDINAARSVDLYRVKVPVADQSPEVRAEAIERGLAIVLDRVTGTSQWREQVDPELLNDASQSMLEQFGYLQQGANSELLLDIHFSGAAINDLLSQSNAAVWGKVRPRVLFWIARESGNRRMVVSENTLPSLVDRLEKAMGYWGIPGLLPLMDIKDTANLNVSDLWGFFVNPVEAASRRYDSDAIVMARVNRDVAGRWNVLWQLRMEGETIEQGQLEARSTQAWVDSLLGEVSARLARVYAVSLDSAQEERLQLTVKGINTFRDYADVYRLLSNMAPVKDTLPVKVSQSLVQFDLLLSGQQQQVVEHLALHQSLVATLVDESADVESQLVYRWQP